MSKYMETAVVVSQKTFGDGIFDLTLQTEKIAGEAVAGQFVSLYSNDGARLLPRPLSLCGIDREKGRLRLCYRVTGRGTGTEEFSRLKTGDTLRILGPLGNGFTVLPGKKALVVGGGIGVPPMLELVREIREGRARGPVFSGDRNVDRKGRVAREQTVNSSAVHKLFTVDATELTPADVTVVMGYRDKNTFLLDEFEKLAPSYVSSDNGEVGTKGTVVDAIEANGLAADVIYACGPLPMLRALKVYALDHDMECFISMEERMACGIGACLACVCHTAHETEHTNQKNARICADGPVFDAREVEI